MNTKTILSDLVVKQKFFTSMKYNFFLHSHINKLGKSQIFLYVNINGEKKRLPLNYYVSPGEWNPKTQRTKEHEINLVLENIEAKITQIKTFFYISKKHLDLEKFLLEFSNASPSYDFIAFMKKCIIDRNFEDKTNRSELGIANKLQRYVNGPLPFSKIDIQFLDIYRGHLYKIGNKKSTVNNNIKKIKKYLGVAQKYGIILNFDLDQVKVGKTSGNRTFLVKQEIAKYIKETDETAKVIFIGPCTAKKAEAKQERVAQYVDCVLTFEELQALIDSRDIELTELPEDVLDNASYYGRIFARSGGVSEAVGQAIKEQNIDFTVDPLPCDGIEECKTALLKASRGILKNNFIEGMACVGGCIGGAGCLTHEAKDKNEIDKYGKEALEKSIGDALSQL